jgi:hypothetical protein
LLGYIKFATVLANEYRAFMLENFPALIFVMCLLCIGDGDCSVLQMIT